jgi:hypothetical protein
LHPICEHGSSALIIEDGHLRLEILHIVVLPDYLLPLILALPSFAPHLLVKLPILVFLFLNILFNLSEPLFPVHHFQPLLHFLRLYAVKLLYRLQSDFELINLCHDNPGLVLNAHSIHP